MKNNRRFTFKVSKDTPVFEIGETAANIAMEHKFGQFEIKLGMENGGTYPDGTVKLSDLENGTVTVMCIEIID